MKSILRYLQNALLIFGAAALGLVLSVVLVFCAMALVQTPGAGEDWGAAMFFVFFSLIGAVVGTIFGALIAISWISQRGNEPWTLATWGGVVLGAASGLMIRILGLLKFSSFSLLADLIEWKIGLVLFLTAAACLGGIFCSFIQTVSKRRATDRLSSQHRRTS